MVLAVLIAGDRVLRPDLPRSQMPKV